MSKKHRSKKTISACLGIALASLGMILSNAYVYAGSDEIPAHIAAVDVENRQVKLSSRDTTKIDYRLAFDAEIRLLNGDLGSIANVRVGNYITAVIDPAKKVIYAIHVVEN